MKTYAKRQNIKLERKLRRDLHIEQEAKLLEKLNCLTKETDPDALKIVSWNCRSAVIAVGKAKVTKLDWLKYTVQPEIICVQESFSL